VPVTIPFADRALSVDANLLVELTKRCNYECAHCYTNASPRARSAEPSTAQVAELVGSAGRLGFRAVTLSGGELMLREDVEQIVAAAPPDVELWLFTSGIRVTTERLARWKRTVTGYAVSLDGDPRTHEALRRSRGAFAQITGFLKRLAAVGCRTQLQSMVVKDGLERLEIVIEIAEAMAVERILFSHVSPDGRGTQRGDLQMDHHELDELFFRVRGLQDSTPIRLRTNLMPRELAATRFPKPTLHVLPTGEILPWFGAPATFALATLSSRWDLEEAFRARHGPELLDRVFDRARAAALAHPGAAVPVDDLLVAEFKREAVCA